MNKQTFDRFRARARAVRLPDAVREGVCQRAQAERDGRPGRRGVTRRAALGLGLGAAGVAAALLAAAVVARPTDDDPTSGGAGGWFALRAYAEGLPQGEHTVLAQQSVSLAGSLGGSVTSGWYAAHAVDLACEGADIERVTYTLEGDYMSEAGQPSDLSTKAVWFDALYRRPDQVPEGETAPTGDGAGTSFSVPYDEQAADEDNFSRQIWTSFPTDDEIEAAFTEVQAKYPNGFIDDLTWEQALEYLRLDNRYTLLLEKRSGELLAQTTLVMTATCADGRELTRRYAIAPREDFDQVYGERLEAEVEPSATVNLYRDDPAHADEVERALAELDRLYAEPLDLYTITELDG